MFSSFLNWKNALAFCAIIIVSGTIFYSNYLTKKMAEDERKKVRVWAESLKTKGMTDDPATLNLTNIITNENSEIPIIETDEFDRPTGNYLNLDPEKVKNDSAYLSKKITEFKNLHNSIKVDISSDPVIYNKYYYGDSNLLNEVGYYPLVQLFVVSLFILITLIMMSTSSKATQNQVWAGMAKEAAHQLGTPISSLEGWVEMLKESNKTDDKIIKEIGKDIDRLKLVTDRFGKIGSIPKLEQTTLMPQLEHMVDYIKKRSSDKVRFQIVSSSQTNLSIPINVPLFDWVIENLLKNALDAMEGRGLIQIQVDEEKDVVKIDVSDSGKGIPKKDWHTVFKPGFTTKKRGWGLGLSLSKRIIEQYHKGQLYVKSSEPNKGTCIRIVLKKGVQDA